MDNILIERVIREVIESLQKEESEKKSVRELKDSDADSDAGLTDLTEIAVKKANRMKNSADDGVLLRMMSQTPARIGVGRAGPRLLTRTQIALQADHAIAQDSVYTDVDSDLLNELGLPCFQTLCADRNEFLTRPDLGRQFSEDTLQDIKRKISQNKSVQIYVSDGLSSKAITANLSNILPALTKGLNQRGIEVGNPFFVRLGRVPAMDIISEALNPDVTCLLIGERPGLGSAESMSAYIVYKGFQGMPESRRTVVSNIHSGGISAVEAGAYIAEVIEKMLGLRVSGVDLKL